MKKCSSLVWQFFERVLDGEDKKRCVAVVCKLCESQYKFFGNTTNLRVHLINKHPIQWDLGQNGTFDESHFKFEDEESNISTAAKSTPKRKYTKRARRNKNVRYSVSVNNEDAPGKSNIPHIEIQRVDVLENSDTDAEGEETINLVRQMHAGLNSDEEWLEEDPYQITHIETYEPPKKKMKYKKIKREVTSPTGLPGFYVAPKPEQKIIYEDFTKKDEYSIFGEYVANKLRKFKTPRTRGNLQQLITTMLWQAEYGLYENAETVKRVLMYSIQPELPTMPEAEMSTQVQAEEIIIHREDPDQSATEAELSEIINE